MTQCDTSQSLYDSVTPVTHSDTMYKAVMLCVAVCRRHKTCFVSKVLVQAPNGTWGNMLDCRSVGVGAYG